MEITALVFGILSVVLPGVGLFFAVPALVMGILSIVRKRKKGFGIAATVMGGVALPIQLGIAAAIAIPAFINYTKRAKSAEATMNVEALSTALVAYREEHGQFPPSTEWTPAESCCDRACESPARRAAFEAPAWARLRFSPGTAEVRYQYRWTVEGGDTARVEATGDLDCDGIMSRYSKTVSGAPVAIRGGELTVENELE